MHNEPLEAHEHTEHALHAEHDGFVSRVAIQVAVLAVLAAAAGNLESIEAEKVLVGTSEATLEQDKATDAWGEYEADSIKRHLYVLAAEQNGAKAEKYRKTSDDQNAKQAKIRTTAKEAEDNRNSLLAEARVHESRHHWLTGSATLCEIAIALSTVALVTRRKLLWAGGALLGVGGAALLGLAYMPG
jgi:hypothetical protein